MIPVEEAINILKNHTPDYGTEDMPILHSYGRILREEIVADKPMPPFDRVSMDGIAIRYEAFEKGTRKFLITSMAAAGVPQLTLTDDASCFEVMTGSFAPKNADTIIPYEWLNIDNGYASIIKENVIRGQNIHLRGTDHKPGDILIKSGNPITPSEIGVLAATGKNKVKVSRLPKVMIISTGNELVEIDQEPLPHQVRISNVYQLQAGLLEMKIESDRSHFQDDYDAIKTSLSDILVRYDIIIISGGVSEGKYDFIPSAVDSLEVRKHFYKVSQRPGKPFWFGTHPDGCYVFAIPGNPVSSFLCFIRYIKPWLESCLQKEIESPAVAILSEDVSFTPDLTYFLTVQLEQNIKGETIAIPVKGHGSGDLANLVNADAFIELPRGRDEFKKGEVFTVHKF